MDDALIYLIIIISALLAGAIKSVAGFGAGVILLLVLSQFYDVITSATLNQAICTALPVIMALQYRKYIEWKKVVLPGVCFIAASVVTIRLVKNIDLTWLGVMLGVFLVLLSLYYLFWAKNIRIEPTPLIAVAFGLVSGVLSGLFSVGVTLMAVYFLAVTEDRNHYMADLQSVMAVSSIISLATRISSGFYRGSMVLPTVFGIAGVLVGLQLGRGIAGRLDAGKINRFIYILVGLTGIETIIKQLI